MPRANRRQRPVYIGQNPINGTYRRYHEGDYRCSPDEVGRMLADQSEDRPTAGSSNTSGSTTSTRTASSISPAVLGPCPTTPGWPWTIGASWRSSALAERPGDEATGRHHRRAADVRQGRAIRTTAIPGYQVDYRETLSTDPRSAGPTA